ncbi:MFS general substrate transporter [Sistotremastrum niveocremeum HHB9708]|uniref:MFS general substrate transporter n=1 Tax=Sistotremastrum niveocremeum HHB9708 TaxID=1314777 RepID=A0A164QP98_9AGAM|nr:MFS general substrate transporter [Sistotremastrum niveocremeum HHB9708]
MPTERTPLIAKTDSKLPPSPEEVDRQLEAPPYSWWKSSSAEVGPLEIPRSQRTAILIGIWIATFVTSLNTTLVATLLSAISSDFQKANQASWLGTSYLLATCTFTPLYGRLCNVMGRKSATQTAVLFLAVGVLGCGLAPGMELLILARFIAGIGGGGILTIASVVTSDMYSMRDRSMVQGVVNLFNGLGMGLAGPIIGWRWAFILQVPFFLISLFLITFNLNYVTPGVGTNAWEMLKRIDFGGCFALLLSIGSILTLLSLKYNDELPWDDNLVIASIAIAVIFTILFIVVELAIVPEPIMAPFLLKMKIPVLVAISNLLVSVASFAVMYYLPMWYETVRLDSAGVAGLHLIPNCVAMSLGALVAGIVMQRTGKYLLVNHLLGSFPSIFVGGLVLMGINSDCIPGWLSTIPVGFGIAAVLQTTLIALLASIPHSVMAIGIGFGQLFRGIGQVFGVAAAAAIFQAVIDPELRSRIKGPGSDELISRMKKSYRVVAELPPDVQILAREAYANALRAVFIACFAAVVLSILFRLGIPERSLDSATPEADTSASDASTVVDDNLSEADSEPSEERIKRTANDPHLALAGDGGVIVSAPMQSCPTHVSYDGTYGACSSANVITRRTKDDQNQDTSKPE